ncbi:hypothetical protein QE152_g20722 [Popillia japonica]|uniref:Uncharacterized protein n=1 Tax=Popillia japonica TaxID=7064 RepID=A0AAW1KPC6_POPJA
MRNSHFSLGFCTSGVTVPKQPLKKHTTISTAVVSMRDDERDEMTKERTPRKAMKKGIVSMRDDERDEMTKERTPRKAMKKGIAIKEEVICDNYCFTYISDYIDDVCSCLKEEVICDNYCFTYISDYIDDVCSCSLSSHRFYFVK